MKKYKLIIFMSMISIFCLSSVMSVKALNATASLGDGVKNIYLTYVHKNLGSSEFSNQYSFMPLINYYDKNGELTKNGFMDTFLFLPSTSFGIGAHGSSLDWDTYLSNQDELLDYLNSSLSILNNTLNTSIEVNIMFSVIIPPDGSLQTLKEYVEMQLERFNSKNYSNMNFIGFYWWNEEIYESEVELVKSFNEYVKEKGYKTIWIPHMKSNELYLNGYDYGFDFVSIQSNHYFDGTVRDYTRLEKANNVANQNSFGVEVELDANICIKYQYAYRYREFLRYGIRNNWNNSINVYYAIYLNQTSDFDIFPNRNIYDLTYKYAKQTLTEKDIYNNIALNKPYTSTSAYTQSDKTSGYMDVSGKELTDGIYGNENLGTEWVGFNKQISDDKYYIIIDLERKFSGINNVSAEFLENIPASVGVPNDIKVYYSDDNTEFIEWGNLSDYSFQRDGSRVIKMLESNPISARYIKLEMDKGNEYFVFLSEIGINKIDSLSLDSYSSYVSVDSKPIAVNIDNETNGLLTSISSDENVATCYIENNVLYINPIGLGSATITIEESVNNTIVEYKINVGEPIKVPNTLSAKSSLLVSLSMFLIFLGIGLLVFIKKQLKF